MAIAADQLLPKNHAGAYDRTATSSTRPTLPKIFVRRPRLLAKLDAAEQVPLIVVSGPAGAGKTTLVADWSRSRNVPGRVAWVRFAEADNRVEFWPPVLACLAEHGVDLAGASTTGGKRPERARLVSIAAALGRGRKRLVLVLDGYDVETADVAEDLDYLLQYSRGRLQVVIVSRADPLLPLYRYRLKGELVEIRSADLAFTDMEAADLLARSGVKLGEDSVRELTRRTKGWAAGLRFASMFLGQRDDPTKAVLDVSGDSGSIAEYLVAEVLGEQPPATRRLLLHTSVADSLQPGLIEAIGGRSAARTLAGLARGNAFVEPLPEHPGCYRYHPLFRDLLRAELAYESPQAFARLHRKAARWYADAGLLSAAVQHYAAVGDWQDAAGLVVDDFAVGQVLLDDGSGALTRILRAMPADVPGSAAALVRGALALSSGDNEAGRAELDRARDVACEGLSSRERSVLLTSVVLEAAHDRFPQDPVAAVRLAELAEHGLRPRDAERVPIHQVELDAMVWARKGHTLLRSGALDEATAAFRNGAETASVPGCEQVLADCWASMALVAAVQGRLSVAVELAERSVAVADNVGTPLPDRPAAAHVALAWVRVEEYDLRGAVEPLKAARTASALADDPVLRGLVAVIAGRLRRAHGDLAGAIAVVDAALAVDAEHGRWLDDLLRVERAGLKIVNGEVAVGVSEIEAVEEPPDAKVALAVAQARLEQGDDGGVVASLTRVLGKNSPLGDQVSGWLLEVAQQLRRGHPGRARVALDRSLRLAAPEKLRRPFREAPEPVQRLLIGDSRLATENAWLGGTHRPGSPAATVPAQRQPPKQVVEEVPPTRMIETLTDKELEVLGHLAELLSTDEIAGTMFVSVNTIRTHVRSILRKLGVSRRNEAVRRARQLGLITAPNGAPG